MGNRSAQCVAHLPTGNSHCAHTDAKRSDADGHIDTRISLDGHGSLASGKRWQPVAIRRDQIVDQRADLGGVELSCRVGIGHRGFDREGLDILARAAWRA